MEFVVYAVLLGIMLSLVLIGPAFFLLIETSITKGWRSAIALDAGVVSADLLCIAFAYTGVGGIVEYIGGASCIVQDWWIHHHDLRGDYVSLQT